MGLNQYRRTTFLHNGSADLYNDTGNQYPGERGSTSLTAGNEYARVKLDSGATSATATGVVAAAQLAFWKDKRAYIVTNNIAQANGGVGDARNFLAGIFRNAVTAGADCMVLTRGNGIDVKCTSSPTAGDVLVANTGTAADSVAVAAGTASTLPFGTIGVAKAAKVGANVSTDVSIPYVL